MLNNCEVGKLAFRPAHNREIARSSRALATTHSTQPLKPPRRIWIKTRKCACGDCQIIPRKRCPAIDALNPGEWMYVSADPGD